MAKFRITAEVVGVNPWATLEVEAASENEAILEFYRQDAKGLIEWTYPDPYDEGDVEATAVEVE